MALFGCTFLTVFFSLSFLPLSVWICLFQVFEQYILCVCHIYLIICVLFNYNQCMSSPFIFSLSSSTLSFFLLFNKCVVQEKKYQNLLASYILMHHHKFIYIYIKRRVTTGNNPVTKQPKEKFIRQSEMKAKKCFKSSVLSVTKFYRQKLCFSEKRDFSSLRKLSTIFFCLHCISEPLQFEFVLKEYLYLFR